MDKVGFIKITEGLSSTAYYDFRTFCIKIKEFHNEYIAQYTAKVARNRMPKIKKIYLDRESKLKESLKEFHDLTFDDQMSKLEFYCTEFGLYTSDMEASDFGKVPAPSLSEIQEAQSDSFLSLSEVLSY